MSFTIMLCACEPSGDALGADLMRALGRTLAVEPDFIGFGGPLMKALGFRSLFDIDDLSVLGITEVVPKIPVLFSRLNEAAALARIAQPNVIVMIDSPGFHMRLAQKIYDVDIPIVQYVAPQVWAWRSHRALVMQRLYHEVLCLLPFEPDFFQSIGMKASFVGHPVIESDLQKGDRSVFYQKHQIDPQDLILLVLPGSRSSEIDRLMPVFGAALEKIRQTCPQVRLVIPTLESKWSRIAAFESQWPRRDISPIYVTDPIEKSHAFAAAHVAMAASGTVALELALMQIPMVVAYDFNMVTSFFAKRLVRVPYVNLVNLLLGRPVVPELLMDKLTPDTLSRAVLTLLTDTQAYMAQKQALEETMVLLGKGRWSPADHAAKAVRKYVKEKL